MKRGKKLDTTTFVTKNNICHHTTKTTNIQENEQQTQNMEKEALKRHTQTHSFNAIHTYFRFPDNFPSKCALTHKENNVETRMRIRHQHDIKMLTFHHILSIFFLPTKQQN